MFLKKYLTPLFLLISITIMPLSAQAVQIINAVKIYSSSDDIPIIVNEDKNFKRGVRISKGDTVEIPNDIYVIFKKSNGNTDRRTLSFTAEDSLLIEKAGKIYKDSGERIPKIRIDGTDTELTVGDNRSVVSGKRIEIPKNLKVTFDLENYRLTDRSLEKLGEKLKTMEGSGRIIRSLREMEGTEYDEGAFEDELIRRLGENDLYENIDGETVKSLIKDNARNFFEVGGGIPAEFTLHEKKGIWAKIGNFVFKFTTDTYVYTEELLAAVVGTRYGIYCDREKVSFLVDEGTISVIRGRKIEVAGRIMEIKDTDTINEGEFQQYLLSEIKAPFKEFENDGKAITYLKNQMKEARGDMVRRIALENVIGRIYFEYGNYKKAIRIFESLRQEAAKLEKSEWLAILLNNIGTTQYEMRQYREAIESFNEALEIDYKIFDKEHPETAVIYRNLSLAHHASGDDKEAEKYNSKALKIEETSAAYNTRALMAYNSWRYDRAIRDFENAQANGNPQENSESFISYNNLGSAWRKKGKYQEAISNYKKALAIIENSEFLSGKYHNLVTIYNNLGLTFKDKGYYEAGVLKLESEVSYNKAVSCFEKALENLKKCQNCRPDELYDTDRIVSHNGLGAMYQAHGKYEDAMQAFDKALSLIEKNHSDCSLADCAVAYNGLGSVYQSQGRYEDAIRAFGKAMHIISKSKNKMGKDYPYIAITAYSGLALTDKDGKKDEYFKKALDISISKFGEEHPKTKLVKALIKKEQEKQN